MKKLIVITTHNGYSFIENLLSDIKSFKIKNEEICIVDNGSDKEEHFKYLNKLKKDNIIILNNPKGGYNLGGYKYALDHLKSDIWFLIQDSIRIKQDIFSRVEPLLTDNNVYSFLTFPYNIYDSHDDKRLTEQWYGTTVYSKGAFPSSYFAKDEVLQKVKNFWIFPKNKIEAMAMERGASIIFDRFNIKIIGLDMYNSSRTSDPNGYPFFYKIYGSRS